MKDVKCPFCGEETTFIEDMDFYKCPGCSCEIWPQEQSNNPMEGLAEVIREDTHRGNGKGGSGNKSKRKKSLRRKEIYERYLL